MSDITTSAPVELSPMHTMFRDEIVKNVTAHNSNASSLAATKTDRDSVIASLIENAASHGLDKHARLVSELTDKLEAAKSALTDAAGPVADKMISEASTNREQLETSVKASAGNVASMVKVFKNMLEPLYPANVVEEILTTIPSTVSGATGKVRGSGTRGPNKSVPFRIRNFVFHVDGKPVPFVPTGADKTPSQGTVALLKHIGGDIDADRVREAFAAAQGTEDSSAFKNEVTFTLTATGKDGVAKTYNVRAVRDVTAETAAVAADNGAQVA